MSRITDLIERMAIIPEREKKAMQLADMIAIRASLETAASSAERLRASTTAISGIEGADFVEKARGSLDMAASSARKFKARLEGGAGFDRKSADGAVTSINERLSDASGGVTRGWRALVEGRTRRFSPIAAVADQAGLAGSVPFGAAITSLEGWKESPPADEAAAAAFSATSDSLPAAVAGLGLQGKAGQFMVEAAKGSAKARDLQDQDVLAFLQANPTIWSMLKVGL